MKKKRVGVCGLALRKQDESGRRQYTCVRVLLLEEAIDVLGKRHSVVW